MIPKAKHLKASGFEEGGSSCIPHFAVLAAVEFDDELCLQAGEIYHIWQERVLESELEAIDLAVSDNLPEPIFSFCPVAAEPGGMWADPAAN